MRSREGVRARLAAARVAATLAIGGAIALLLAACSPGADYPGILDRPTPRADTPMSPDQVQQVTNSLISDRDHLSAEAQTPNPANAPAAGHNAPAAPAATGTTPTAGAAARP